MYKTTETTGGGVDKSVLRQSFGFLSGRAGEVQEDGGEKWRI